MMFASYIYYYVGQNTTSSTVILGTLTASIITIIVAIISVIATLFVIFMLKDALNNYVFLGIVSTVITSIWLVVLLFSPVIIPTVLYGLIPIITVLIAIFAIVLDVFVFFKTFELNKKMKLARNHVASIESEYKTLINELKNIENDLKSIREKLESAQKEIENQLTRIEVIRLYSW